MTKRYTVRADFQDKAGRTLTTRKLELTEDSAKAALIDAHKVFAEVVSSDPRIDVVSSVVEGPAGERIATTDYADELHGAVGRDSLSSTGLLEEVDPELRKRQDAVEVDYGGIAQAAAQGAWDSLSHDVKQDFLDFLDSVDFAQPGEDKTVVTVHDEQTCGPCTCEDCKPTVTVQDDSAAGRAATGGESKGSSGFPGLQTGLDYGTERSVVVHQSSESALEGILAGIDYHMERGRRPLRIKVAPEVMREMLRQVPAPVGTIPLAPIYVGGIPVVCDPNLTQPVQMELPSRQDSHLDYWKHYRYSDFTTSKFPWTSSIKN